MIMALGAVLAAGSVLGMSCEQPAGNNGNGGNKNENPSNPGNGGNENPGNSGNTDDEQENPGKQYSTPYDIALGNGNYMIRNFLGATDDIKVDTHLDDTNHYLGEIETYVKGQATDLQNSVGGRTTYFDEAINSIQNNDDYHINAGFTQSANFDRAINSIASDAAESIFQDILKNLGTYGKRRAFTTIYRVMANEAFKANLGLLSSNSTQSIEYEDEKNSIISFWNGTAASVRGDIDIAQEYNNNFAQITDLSDRLLGEAVANMNNGVTVEDLQKFINLITNAYAAKGVHERTRGNLNHQKNNCEMMVGIVSAMEDVLEGIVSFNTQQDHGLSL